MSCAVIGTVNNRRRARIIVNLALKEFYKNVKFEQFLSSCDLRGVIHIYLARLLRCWSMERAFADDVCMQNIS